SGGKYIQDTQDVVLDFPFKDGILTASMIQEETNYSYSESFINEVIEKNEIDCLLDKKIFVNVNRFEKKEKVDSNNSIFDIQDNLIIHGNNLLALHSICDFY